MEPKNTLFREHIISASQMIYLILFIFILRICHFYHQISPMLVLKHHGTCSSWHPPTVTASHRGAVPHIVPKFTGYTCAVLRAWYQRHTWRSSRKMQDGKDDSFFADGLVGRILTYQIDISIYIYILYVLIYIMM